MEKEKRLNLRIDFHHEVVITSTREQKKIMNFSKGGAFVQTENPAQFEKGAKINLYTKLPLEKKAMLIKAQIAHIASKGIGVKFLDLWGHDAEAINYNFEVFKNTLPLPATKYTGGLHLLHIRSNFLSI